jgi:cell division cycle 2-like protein
MASKAKSRWADDDEPDAALEAQLKKEKEEKKRLKAEKARKLEAQRQAREGAAQQDGDGAQGPPAKRRKVSSEPDTRQPAGTSDAKANVPKLLRFEGGAFGRCRSVEN